jgi:hypothetical protein
MTSSHGSTPLGRVTNPPPLPLSSSRHRTASTLLTRLRPPLPWCGQCRSSNGQTFHALVRARTFSYHMGGKSEARRHPFLRNAPL